MVPAILSPGRSFKGAARYYFHDKGADTDERVAWVEIVNLPTADHEKAWRMMAHTAIAQADLKEAAGIKATGRKLEAPVFTYSLSWHPSETPTREEMTKAAMETLKVLGLEEHQAVIVCHDDEPHPHVHLIVNRVHPETGKAATLSRSKRKLSEWALKYEQSRGQVFVEKRLENALKRAKGMQTYDPRIARPEFELGPANDNLSAEFIRKDWKRKAALLYRQHETAHRDLRARLKALDAAFNADKKQSFAQREAKLAEYPALVKAAFKLNWRNWFAAERKARWRFERRERSALGKVWNMATTAQELRSGSMRERVGTRERAEGNVLGVLFAILNKNERMAALERRLQRERKKLAGRQWDAINKGQRAIRAEARKRDDARRQTYLSDVKSLRADEARLEAAIRDDWQQYRAGRDGAFRTIASRKGRYQMLKDSYVGPYQGVQRERERQRRPKDDDKT